jgi:general secretion pathway protein G
MSFCNTKAHPASQEQLSPRRPLKRMFNNSGVGQAFSQEGQGFTLLELLVVMVIIGLLASYVAPRFFNQISKSEVKAARAQLDAFDKALGAYRLDVGRYPTTDQGLQALVEPPQAEHKWGGPYLAKSVPPDPWGRPYIYRQPGEQNHDYELLSLGKDGQRGGTGENVDLSVWDTGR